MNEPSAGRLRPIYARGIVFAGLLGTLIPLSRRVPKTQSLVLELPSRLLGAKGQVEVAYTREGDSEPLGGYSLTFPNGAPGSVRREISAPEGRYRLDISLEFAAKPSSSSGVPVRKDIGRQVSFTGTDIRVVLEDTPP